MKRSPFRSVLKAAFVAGFAFWFQSADAGPISIGGTLAGNRGDAVTPTLFDESLVNFEAADIKITFDPVFLTFDSEFAGTLLPGGLLAANTQAAGSLMEILVSIVPALPPVTGGPGSLFGASFLINNAAPFGTTPVTFETLDPTLYDFPVTTAQITVRQADASVPIGNISILLLTGFAGLWAARRKII